MTSISYELIFNEFLGNITDYSLARNDAPTTVNLMTEWLHKALSRSYLRRLFSSLTMNDDIGTIEFEMNTVVDEDSDVEFVIYVVAKFMVAEWLESKVKTTTLTMQAFSGKDQKFYSQAAHLSELRALLNDVKSEARALVMDRGFIYNPYLEDE